MGQKKPMPRPFHCQTCKKTYAVQDMLDAHTKGCQERKRNREKEMKEAE